FAVFGDATINGSIRANSVKAPDGGGYGAGGYTLLTRAGCGVRAGADGVLGPTGGGGGGGAHFNVGGRGGDGPTSGGGDGGQVRGNAALVPLVGGCPGGTGGGLGAGL